MRVRDVAEGHGDATEVTLIYHRVCQLDHSSAGRASTWQRSNRGDLWPSEAVDSAYAAARSFTAAEGVAGDDGLGIDASQQRDQAHAPARPRAAPPQKRQSRTLHFAQTFAYECLARTWLPDERMQYNSTPRTSSSRVVIPPRFPSCCSPPLRLAGGACEILRGARPTTALWAPSQESLAPLASTAPLSLAPLAPAGCWCLGRARRPPARQRSPGRFVPG